MSLAREIKDYIRDRDSALETENLTDFIDFIRRHGDKFGPGFAEEFDKAVFKAEIIKQRCQEKGKDYDDFREWCEKLDGRIWTYNRWIALISGDEVYTFKLADGSSTNVPAELVVEL